SISADQLSAVGWNGSNGLSPVLGSGINGTAGTAGGGIIVRSGGSVELTSASANGGLGGAGGSAFAQGDGGRGAAGGNAGYITITAAESITGSFTADGGSG